MSIRLSATVDTARLCAKDNRTVPVTVLDSRQLSMGTGLLVLKAAPLADVGAFQVESAG
jgi:fatty acid-binding protein DegV